MPSGHTGSGRKLAKIDSNLFSSCSVICTAHLPTYLPTYQVVHANGNIRFPIILHCAQGLSLSLSPLSLSLSFVSLSLFPFLCGAQFCLIIYFPLYVPTYIFFLSLSLPFSLCHPISLFYLFVFLSVRLLRHVFKSLSLWVCPSSFFLSLCRFPLHSVSFSRFVNLYFHVFLYFNFSVSLYSLFCVHLYVLLTFLRSFSLSLIYFSFS